MRPKAGRTERLNSRPTFPEFVTMLLDEKWKFFDDKHWKSYQDLCHPLNIHYDYVLKLESIKDQMFPVLELLASDTIPVSHLASLVIPMNKSNKRNNDSDDIAPEMLDLSMEQRVRIVKRYQADMEMFGYGFDVNTAKCSYS